MNENTLGGVIRKLRKGNGWTLRQMSDKVGIPFSTLAKVEQNKLTLTYERLKQLSSRLEMPIAELFAQADVPVQRRVVTGRRSLAFLYVLEGTIEVLTKSCAPVTLTKGNWIYFDGSMERHKFGVILQHIERPFPPREK